MIPVWPHPWMQHVKQTSLGQANFARKAVLALSRFRNLVKSLMPDCRIFAGSFTSSLLAINADMIAMLAALLCLYIAVCSAV